MHPCERFNFRFISTILVMTFVLSVLSCARPGNRDTNENSIVPPPPQNPNTPPPTEFNLPLTSFSPSDPKERKCQDLPKSVESQYSLSSRPILDGNLDDWKAEVEPISFSPDQNLYLGRHLDSFYLGSEKVPEEGEVWFIVFSSLSKDQELPILDSERILKIENQSVSEFRDGSWRPIDSEIKIQIREKTEMQISDRFLLSVAQKPIWMIKWIGMDKTGNQIFEKRSFLPSFLTGPDDFWGVQSCVVSGPGEPHVSIQAASLGVDKAVAEEEINKYQIVLEQFIRQFSADEFEYKPLQIILSNWTVEPNASFHPMDPAPKQQPIFEFANLSEEIPIRNFATLELANIAYQISNSFLTRKFNGLQGISRHLFSILLSQAILNSFSPEKWSLVSKWAYWRLNEGHLVESPAADFIPKISNHHSLERWATILAFNLSDQQILQLIEFHAKIEANQKVREFSESQWIVLRGNLNLSFSEFLASTGLENRLKKFQAFWLVDSEPLEGFGENIGLDEDLDGLLSGIEIFYELDPRSQDTDGDHWTDLGEMFQKTDPKNDALFPEGIVLDGSVDDWFRLAPAAPVLLEDEQVSENCPATADISRYGAVITSEGIWLAMAIKDEALIPGWQYSNLRVEIRTANSEYWILTKTESNYLVIRKAASPVPVRSILLSNPVSRETNEWNLLFSEIDFTATDDSIKEIEVRFRTLIEDTDTDCDDTPWFKPLIQLN